MVAFIRSNRLKIAHCGRPNPSCVHAHHTYENSKFDVLLCFVASSPSQLITSLNFPIQKKTYFHFFYYEMFIHICLSIVITMHVDKLFVFEFVINISWVVIKKVLLF